LARTGAPLATAPGVISPTDTARLIAIAPDQLRRVSARPDPKSLVPYR